MLFREASFLLGLSLENAFKGLWVHQNPGLVEGVKRIPEKLCEHDLCVLAALTGISLSSAEERILKFLSEHIIWYGRYGVPTNEKKSAEFWEPMYEPAFLMNNYPEKFSWPEEIISISRKIKFQFEQING